MRSAPALTMRSLVPALVAIAVVLSITSHDAPAADAACAPAPTLAAFSGDVRHGDAFERPFGAGLVFRLAPSRDPGVPGWTIEIRARGDADPERELSWLVTPPYRFWNPRYVDTSYGHTAAEAARFTPREFRFLLDARDWTRADATVRRILWPGNATNAELDQARAALDAVRSGRGIFHIRDARLGRAPDGIERIERLEFAVELCGG